MFLDAFGAPKEVTADTLKEYPYDLHGTMLLTSSDFEVYIPPRWHGTIYSTEDLLDNYRRRFNPNSTLLTFHALQPYEPELICCERCVLEITALPAGQSLHSESDVVVFLIKLTASDKNILITKELGNELNFFPPSHHYHVRIIDEGIDIVYVDDKIYHGTPSINYQHQRVYNMVSNLQPFQVMSLSGRTLPDALRNLCRKQQTYKKNN